MFDLTRNVDPDNILLRVPFHLGLNCLYYYKKSSKITCFVSLVSLFKSQVHVYMFNTYIINYYIKAGQ